MRGRAGQGTVKGQVTAWEAWTRDEKELVRPQLHQQCVGGWLMADGKQWILTPVHKLLGPRASLHTEDTEP